MQQYSTWGIVLAEGVTLYMLCQFCANPESVAEDKCGFNPPQTIAPCRFVTGCRDI